MTYDIYTIRCLKNNKVYFGRSQETQKRWRAHINMLRQLSHNNMNLQSDWNKYGEENFEFEIIHTFKNLERAIEAEQVYIDSDEHDKYNISGATTGGDTFTNNPRSESTRILKSINSTGKNNPMYGVEKSELMIQRVKEANSKIISIDGVKYNSITEASEKTGINITTIHYRLNSKSENFKNWIYV